MLVASVYITRLFTCCLNYLVMTVTYPELPESYGDLLLKDTQMDAASALQRPGHTLP